MASDQFKCPSCHRLLTKSPAAQILGGKGSFIGFGSLPPTTTCPGCGHGIPTQEMIDGKFDVKAAGCCVLLGVIGLLGGALVAASRIFAGG
jgi:hypothetical protein